MFCICDEMEGEREQKRKTTRAKIYRMSLDKRSGLWKRRNKIEEKQEDLEGQSNIHLGINTYTLIHNIYIHTHTYKYTCLLSLCIHTYRQTDRKKEKKYERSENETEGGDVC